MIKIKICLFFLVGVLLSSCSLQKRCAKCPKIFDTKDTTIYVTKVNNRIDTLFVPSDFATFEAWIKCDSLGGVYLSQIKELQGQRTQVKTVYRDNFIKVECNTDSLLYLISSKDSIISKITNSVKREVVEVETKYIPFWVYFVISFLVLFAIYLVLKVN